MPSDCECADAFRSMTDDLNQVGSILSGQDASFVAGSDALTIALEISYSKGFEHASRR